MSWVDVPESPGFQRDTTPEPTRPIAPASTDELAARQTAKAAARLRSGEAQTAEDHLAEGRRRFLAAHGLTEEV